MSDIKNQIAEIDKAITSVLSGGQSYKVGNRSLTRGDLATLYQMKKELENNAAGDNNGGLGRGVAVGFFDKR